jgi:hypothetical protein
VRHQLATRPVAVDDKHDRLLCDALAPADGAAMRDATVHQEGIAPAPAPFTHVIESGPLCPHAALHRYHACSSQSDSDTAIGVPRRIWRLLRTARVKMPYKPERFRTPMEDARGVKALGHSLQDGHGVDAHLRALFQRPAEMPKAERVMAIRRGVFVLTCLAAHSKDEVSLRTSWDRHDALFVLTTNRVGCAVGG